MDWKGTRHVKQNVELEIYGQTYRIATEYSADYMKSLGDMLDAKLSAVLKGSRTRSLPQALILVSLDIIDEYIQLKRECQEERSMLRGQVSELIQEVDAQIAGLEEDSMP
jgi:cell division protein ZapA (FtsZ GTPase activity inhibitor)